MDEQNKPNFSYNSPNSNATAGGTSSQTPAGQGGFIPREELKPRAEFQPPTGFSSDEPKKSPVGNVGWAKPERAPIMNQMQRLQYSQPKSGFSVWPFVVILIVAAGMAFLGYLYMDDIVQLISGRSETPAVVEEEIPPYFMPVAPEEAVPTPPAFTPVPVTENELKMEAIGDARQNLADYFSASGVYPASLQTDGDIFYCYRKNGAHYILGTILDSGSVELANDLDSEYYCGSAVKDCADPVYCEEPNM